MALLVVPVMAWSLFGQVGKLDHLMGARLSLAAFIVSCVFMFGNSTVYHALFYLVAVHPAMQILDHAGIYMLIAGTYTPYIVIGCQDVSYPTSNGPYPN